MCSVSVDPQPVINGVARVTSSGWGQKKVSPEEGGSKRVWPG